MINTKFIKSIVLGLLLFLSIYLRQTFPTFTNSIDILFVILLFFSITNKITPKSFVFVGLATAIGLLDYFNHSFHTILFVCLLLLFFIFSFFQIKND